MSLRAVVAGLVLLTVASGAAAAPRLTEPQVRAFVQGQSRAWNAGDLDRYFATFTPDAKFTDQALANDNSIVPYGVSTAPEARAQARRSFARSKVHEQATIASVAIAPDGHSARVSAQAVSEITRDGAVRRVCAQRLVLVALTPQGLRANSQTDTIVRCR
jgi:hypothetical protein